MSVNEDARKRFADLVRLNGLTCTFISRETERRILEEGVTRFELSLDDARGVLRTVAADEEFVFESEACHRINQILERYAGKKGKISKEQFLQSAAILRDFSNDAISEKEAKRQIKAMMIDEGWEPRRAGLLRSKRWYNRVEV
ncbi:hypothetical protein [Azospirillum griseum]|uniref:Uncharacterized protein n=1 Tax=Azospirillum griseum TaxID=2496639 RepID=A0A431VKP3_9PROT|nr:hypothetical protein [Azospirillum griseum]RTR21491.1 hypothetical protein EJ903_08785 [Azospirillum griseum]